jgi:hypothetical protein
MEQDRTLESDEQKRRLAQSSPRSTDELERRIAELEAALQPASRELALAELTGCLTLLAPSGMNESDRREWLRVALSTLPPLPIGVLRQSARDARMIVSFVSDLLPMLVERGKHHEGRLKAELFVAQRQLETALHPKPMLAPPPPDKPFTVYEIAALRDDIFKLGKAGGFFDPDTLAEAEKMRERREG